MGQSKQAVSNPMYNASVADEVTAEKAANAEYLPVNGFNAGTDGFHRDVYAAVSGEELMKCESYRATGKDCTSVKATASELCANHTCSQVGCFNLKSSKVEMCHQHNNPTPHTEIFGGFDGESNDHEEESTAQKTRQNTQRMKKIAEADVVGIAL